MGIKNLCSPNEDFGRRNKRWNPDFRLTFQWFVAQIEYSRPWKVLLKSGFHLLFLLPKSSFGRDKIGDSVLWDYAISGCPCVNKSAHRRLILETRRLQ
jgi:hypothetical protein